MKREAGMGHQPALLCGENRGDTRALTIDRQHLIGAVEDRSEKAIVRRKSFSGKCHGKGSRKVGTYFRQASA